MNPRRSDKAIWFVIFLNFLFLVLVFGFFEYQFLLLKNNLNTKVIEPIVLATPKEIIITPSPISLPTNSPTPSLSPIAVSATSKPVTQVTYIPLSGGNTQNTDWTTLQSTQFNLNISDYGSKSYAIWDANLKVDNANGTTFARLFDTTHSIAVNGSEINISNTSSSTDVISGQLFFWAGNNTYVIQVKSLNSSTAFVDTGRIKISY
ncbi:hypothetical protein BH10PAT1_BH10PAT1_0600 [soil metagenome]